MCEIFIFPTSATTIRLTEIRNLLNSVELDKNNDRNNDFKNVSAFSQKTNLKVEFFILQLKTTLYLQLNTKIQVKRIRM